MPTTKKKYKRMSKKAVQEQLECAHQLYAHFNQLENPACKYLVNHGHPHASEYVILRAEFDLLKYASDSGERRIAYRNEGENSQYRAPELRITSNWTTNYDDDSEDRMSLDIQGRLNPYWCLYAGDDWDKWAKLVEVAEEVGWPKELKPRIKYGAFDVCTRNYRLVSDLVRALKRPVETCSWHSVPEDVEPYWRFLFSTDSLKSTQEVFQAIRRRQSRWVLPERTIDDDEVDRAPLPLHEKEFVIGRVKVVTETDYALIIPMIPLNAEGNKVIAQTMSALVGYCDKGYPWKGPVRDYFEKWLKYKKDLKSYDKRYKDQESG